MSEPGRETFSFGARVAVPRLHYSVEGVVETFCLVALADGTVTDGAVIRVTQDKGLYGHGDIITAPVASLRPVKT
jgi:hypothetical protein